MKCILNVEKFCQKFVQKLQSPESGARKICPIMGHINWTLMPVNSSIIYGSWRLGTLLIAARAFSPLPAYTCMHSARPLTLPFWPQVQRPSDVSGRLFLVYTSDNANGKSRFWPHILHVKLVCAEVYAKGAEGR